MSKCAKCKSTLSRVGDTWCLGCAGWESIGLELSSSWPTPSLRRIADDLVVQTARNPRALRSSGAGTNLAPAPVVASTAAVPAKVPLGPPLPRSPVLEGVACKSKAGPGRALGEESEYTYQYSEEETARADTSKTEKAISHQHDRCCLVLVENLLDLTDGWRPSQWSRRKLVVRSAIVLGAIIPQIIVDVWIEQK